MSVKSWDPPLRLDLVNYVLFLKDIFLAHEWQAKKLLEGVVGEDFFVGLPVPGITDFLRKLVKPHLSRFKAFVAASCWLLFVRRAEC